MFFFFFTDLRGTPNTVINILPHSVGDLVQWLEMMTTSSSGGGGKHRMIYLSTIKLFPKVWFILLCISEAVATCTLISFCFEVPQNQNAGNCNGNFKESPY